ncbi:MAG: DUF6249 domain-containing protein [Muribaculaceae bacterium]
MEAFDLVPILVPLGICVALPVLIVWIVFRTIKNNDNKRAEVLIKAIESNNNIDADKLAEALAKPRKSPRQLLTLRLLRGCIFTFIGIAATTYHFIAANDEDSQILLLAVISIAIGISYLVVYFMTRNDVNNTTAADKQ